MNYQKIVKTHKIIKEKDNFQIEMIVQDQSKRLTHSIAKLHIKLTWISIKRMLILFKSMILKNLRSQNGRKIIQKMFYINRVFFLRLL